MSAISEHWKSLSPEEKRAGSGFRAFVKFKDGNTRYFYSWDNTASRAEAEAGVYDPNLEFGYKGLLSRIVGKYWKVTDVIEIYANKENELVRKYSKGKEVNLGRSIVFTDSGQQYQILFEKNHPDNYFEEKTPQ